MELSSQEAGEIPIPINSSYGGGNGHGHGHMIHHNHHHHHHDPTAAAAAVSHNHSNLIPSSAVPQNQNPSNTNGPSMPTSLDHHHHQHHPHLHHEEEEQVNIVPYSCKKVGVRYKECLKNHAAAMGGTATDGCGEFMPNGEEGTIEALNCSACNCHRNFHRKEVEGEQQPSPSSWDHNFHHTINRVGVGSRKFLLGPGHRKNLLAVPSEGLGYHTMPSSRTAAPHQMIMPYNMGMGMGIGMGMGMGALPSESDEQEEHDGGGAVGRPAAAQLAKKRFRTKFTQEQKEKMFNFAEKVGWKIQKQEDSVVQNFCQEIGVKRRVLKVWMHNNKHNLAKKNPPPPPPPPPPA